MSVNCSRMTRSPNSAIEFVDVSSSFAVIEAVADWPIGIWAMPGGLLIRSGHWPAPILM